MIKQFIWELNGRQLRRTYSDDGHKIIQESSGIEFDAADDMVGSIYTYIESENFNEPGPETNEITNYGPDSVEGFVREI